MPGGASSTWCTKTWCCRSILTREAFENAIKTLAAIGGSTNAVIHLIAIAGRMGVQLTVEDFDRLGSEMPCLVNLQPSGKYLMEDFCYAGGLPAVMKEICRCCTWARSPPTAAASARTSPRRRTSTRRHQAAGRALQGQGRHRGAARQPRAARRRHQAQRGHPALLKHTGRAVVFENIEDFHRRIDDESLDVDETCILVLKNCGPKGYPGMAEVGNMPLPPKVLRKGITDMVRISDARMSGTAYGTVVLHTAPEAAAGGPLALVKNGDLITLDVAARKLHLHVERRRTGAAPRRLAAAEAAAGLSGYWKLYVDHVTAGRRRRRPGLPARQARRFVPRDNH
jgi:L-arabonate dehydrase